MFPRDGINVVSVLLHSHLAGRKLKLRHIRGDKELLPLAQVNKLDLNGKVMTVFYVSNNAD